jgi:peroxiredoxin
MSVEELISRVAASGLPLPEKLAMLRDEFETNLLPPEIVAAMHKARDELIASGQTSQALRAGDQAPRFALPDVDGNLVRSNDLLSSGALVLTFYRGSWCPYCSFDLAALEEARPKIEKHGAVLAAISQQTSTDGSMCPNAGAFGFPLLTDQGGRLAAKFGIRWNVPPDLQQIHRLLDTDLELINDDKSWTLSMPARYVIGRDGVIAYAELHADYTNRSEPSDILPVLDALQTRAQRELK